MMGEAKRRKLAGSGKPHKRQSDFAGRSLISVFREYAPKPGGGWKWIKVGGQAGQIVYFFEHPEHPGIERIIGGTVELDYYRPISADNPFDEGADRYLTLADAEAAK